MPARRYSGPTQGPTVVDSTAVVRHSHLIPPIAVAVVGCLAIIFGIGIGITIQIQTTEANLQGLVSYNAFMPNLFVFWQPVDLFINPNLSFDERMADTASWIVEVGTFIFIVGYSDALEVAGSSGWIMRRFWFLLSWALFIFNFESDYRYGSIPGAIHPWLGHLEFAVGISAAVMFFPIIGLYLIRKANAMARGG
jgi:hypothetical protein